MIEREGRRPPVTWTTFQARDLGSSTAEMVIETLKGACDRYQPQVLLVAESCTGELIQDQPGALAKGAGLSAPIIPIEMAAYTRKENWGASETFYQLVRGLLAAKAPKPGEEQPPRPADQPPSVNLIGPTKLGFRCRDDVIEIRRLLESMGVRVNVVAPLDATPHDLLRIPEADANVNLAPEVGELTCDWLKRQFKQPTISTVPLGWGATRDFIAEVIDTLGLDIDPDAVGESRLPWYSRSVDSTYLTGKRVFIFADGTHALAAARMARDEMGFEVVGLGTYSRERARDVRALATEYGLEALITDDYLAVERAVTELQPELVLGTQMERHIAKRLGIPCAVISTPAHVQDYPARYSPQTAPLSVSSRSLPHAVGRRPPPNLRRRRPRRRPPRRRPPCRRRRALPTMPPSTALNRPRHQCPQPRPPSRAHRTCSPGVHTLLSSVGGGAGKAMHERSQVHCNLSATLSREVSRIFS